ncbi:WD40 repeat-like protein [Pluteus cervinus]|uniref:WD40 repeat-like protein n=1 Tax=Pluteus cervinus TaxID=181527 RepID=A0ACD3B695_9AGAR|nr:WD40 repeat-like protein [Pluteus cervinus]
MSQILSSGSSFNVSLTFSPIDEGPFDQNSLITRRLLSDWSFSNAQCSVLRAWGTFGASSLQNDGSEPEQTQKSVVVGCQDGTLYVFHQTRRHNDPVNSQPREPSQHSTASSSLHVRRSQPRARVSSSSSLAPFKVTGRSRIVSGITTEQVEAPKNYVDFEDEPEKLKDMLKGKSPRDRTSPQDTSPNWMSPAASRTPSINELGTSPPKRSLSKGLLSPTIPSPRAASTPTSRRNSLVGPRSIHELELRYHIVPPLMRGELSGVGDVAVLEGRDIFAVLTDSGNIFIFHSEDGSCLATAGVGGEDVHSLSEQSLEISSTVWKWSELYFHQVDESLLLVAMANIDVEKTNYLSLNLDAEAQNRTQAVIFEVTLDSKTGSVDVDLKRLARRHFEGSSKTAGIYCSPEGHSLFYRATTHGDLFVQPIHIQPDSPVSSPASVVGPQLSHLLPNPFKTITKSSDNLSVAEEIKSPGGLELDTEVSLGSLQLDNGLASLLLRQFGTTTLGLAWNSAQLVIFEMRADSIDTLAQQALPPTAQVSWISDGVFCVLSQEQMICYKVPAKDQIPAQICIEKVKVGPAEVIACKSLSEILFTRTTTDGTRHLVCLGANAVDQPRERTLWRASPRTNSKPTVTTLLPLDFGFIIQGHSDGYLRQYPLPQMSGKLNTPQRVSDTALSGCITTLQTVQNSRTKETYIIGGADDGSIAIWTMNTLQLCTRWIIFITPVIAVIQFQTEKVGPLRGCVLCVAEDGTIAVIAIDGFQYLYLIPGGSAPLKRVSLGGDNNLMLIYANYTARVWDIKTREFLRSMSLEKAEEALAQWGWTTVSIQDCTTQPRILWAPIPSHFTSLDSASSLLLDLERFITESTEMAKVISTSKEQSRTIFLTLERLRWLLSTLVTPGLDEGIDQLCQLKMGIQRSPVMVGFHGSQATSLYQYDWPPDAWCISAGVTASRQLAVVAVLRALSLFADYTESATKLVSFYSGLSETVVGPTFHAPSLVYLARRWFVSSNEIRSAARVVFDNAVTLLSDVDVSTLTEEWQLHLPCLQTGAESDSQTAALALFICGYIAAERYSLLPSNLLVDIAKSLVSYLHNDQPMLRILAVDLCSRGFHVWQHYIDAVAILRQLFTLATSTKKDTISVQNVAAQARQAVLQVASSHTPLFITTLGLDIISPTSVEHQTSVMQIVAYLIRKRPQVLQPNIPKLMEVVVKSLDPNATTYREAVLDTATEIIGHIVKRYPTVDFHVPTQRLAVGTDEGAIIMYDVKTATRLYVLEGHKRRLSACSFSPDGRRLVTISLEEGTVLIWKVGSSFSSFFNPGAPPRQGHGGSEPFKTIKFNLGDAVNLSDAAASLDAIQFEWTDRNVKVKIRDGMLSFST